MKHFGGVIAISLLMLALPALADGPIIIVNPLTPTIVSGGPDTCPFDIAVVPELGHPNKGKIIKFANGDEIFTGATFAAFTNLSNSKSINLNISGPAQFSVEDNVVTIFGTTVVTLPPNLVPPGLPPVSFAHGRLVLQLGSSGDIISVSFTGMAQNLCELLQ